MNSPEATSLQPAFVSRYQFHNCLSRIATKPREDIGAVLGFARRVLEVELKHISDPDISEEDVAHAVSYLGHYATLLGRSRQVLEGLEAIKSCAQNMEHRNCCSEDLDMEDDERDVPY